MAMMKSWGTVDWPLMSTQHTTSGASPVFVITRLCSGADCIQGADPNSIEVALNVTAGAAAATGAGGMAARTTAASKTRCRFLIRSLQQLRSPAQPDSGEATLT